MTINGVLYGVVGDDMSAFDARERNYTRVEVPLSQIEPVSWQRLPESGHVWVYVPVVAGQPPGVGLKLPSAEFPMVQSYIDVVIEGVSMSVSERQEFSSVIQAKGGNIDAFLQALRNKVATMISSSAP